MSYDETLAYLYNSTPVFEHVGAVAYKEGLENTIALDNHFNQPHRSYATLHVAGTNGKGSCAHMLAAVLQQAGYRVGLYTSPHLVDFRERIRINGKMIDKQRVTDFVRDERAFFEKLRPSFFELTTALAFLYFREQHVDVAVIEVGLGGRLDCTNIITPLLSVITNISFDHTRFLGNTLAKIAGEKAGIIKPHVPVVIGEYLAETRPVFEQRAAHVDAPLIFAQDEPEVLRSTACREGGRMYATRRYGTLKGSLSGTYQEKNVNTVLTALNILRRTAGTIHPAEAEPAADHHHASPQALLPCSIDDIRRGLAAVEATTGLAGRWQLLQRKPTVVCDAGHNSGGWQQLAPQIAAQHCKTLRIVFGMVDDKDIDAVMQLLPTNAVYYWTQAQTKRAIPSARLADMGRARQLRGTDCGNVANAYRQALRDAEADDFIFVGGSCYVVGDLLSLNDF